MRLTIKSHSGIVIVAVPCLLLCYVDLFLRVINAIR